MQTELDRAREQGLRQIPIDMGSAGASPVDPGAGEPAQRG
jgi:hypothetical protein